MDCPNCHTGAPRVFHRISEVPDNSCVLLQTTKEARDFPLGSIDLAFCENCGFVFNRRQTPTHDLTHGVKDRGEQQILCCIVRFRRIIEPLVKLFRTQHALHHPAGNHSQGAFLFKLVKYRIQPSSNLLNLLKNQPPGLVSPKYILSTGRLTEQKSYSFLLKSYALVHREFGEHLIIFGEREEENSLKLLARDLTIHHKVHFLGFDTNPYRFMKNASISVLSSLV